MTPLEEWEQGQRELNETGDIQNYHGPDGLTSCGQGCCELPRGTRMEFL